MDLGEYRLIQTPLTRTASLLRGNQAKEWPRYYGHTKIWQSPEPPKVCLAPTVSVFIVFAPAK